MSDGASSDGASSDGADCNGSYRGVILERFGGPEVLEVREHAMRAPEPDEVLLDIEAIGVNFAELVERRGQYRRHQTLPYPLGKEACGRVVGRAPAGKAAATAADAPAIGERRIVLRYAGGCYADRLWAAPSQLLVPPRHLDAAEAAAFAIAFSTAWYAQVELARARPGESALVTAAAGATGEAALKLAAAVGLEPRIGVVGSAAKRERALESGATHALVDNEHLGRALGEITGGQGVDYALESVGGPLFERVLEGMAPLGRLVVIGFSGCRPNGGPRPAELRALDLFRRSVGVLGLNIENLDFVGDRRRWSELVEFAERHELRPRVGQRLPLAQVAEAHRQLEARRTVGKTVLLP